MAKLVSTLTLSVVLTLNVACSGSDDTSIISQEELVARLDGNAAPIIIDVRTKVEYESGHIPKAINIPMEDFKSNFKQLNVKLSDEVVIYCDGGERSKGAEKILHTAGYFEVRHFAGDMDQWKQENFPCESC